MCVGIEVRMELMRVSSCSGLRFEGEEPRASGSGELIGSILFCWRIWTGVMPGARSAISSNLLRVFDINGILGFPEGDLGGFEARSMGT